MISAIPAIGFLKTGGKEETEEEDSSDKVRFFFLHSFILYYSTVSPSIEWPTSQGVDEQTPLINE